MTLDSTDPERPDVTDPNALKIPRLEIIDFDQQPYVKFPRVGVEVICPGGFKKSNDFYGFTNEIGDSTVIIAQLPGDVAEANGNFTEKALAERDVTLLEKQDVEFAGGKGVLYLLSLKALSGAQLKWSLVFGDETKTTIVGADFPEYKKDELAPLLRKTVLSARTIEAAPPPDLSEFSFTISESEKLKLAPSDIKMMVGAMLTYTEDGVSPIKKKTDPLFVVVQSNAESNITDQRVFAKYRLLQTPHLIDPKVISIEEIEVNGLQGTELVASALDEDTRDPLMIYQANLFDDTGMFLIGGVVGKERSTPYLLEFKRMTYSVKRK